MKNNKNKMIAVVCIALAVVILAAVLIWRLTGSEPQPTDPTGSPTQTTGQDPTGGEPTGSAPTKPETDPSSGTTVPTDPTLEPPQPSTNPTEPSTEPDPDFVEPTFETEPGPAEPEYTAPETDPTEPPAMPSEPPTQPTEPAPTEPVVTWEEVNQTVYAKDTVNVRKGPGTEYDKLGQLQKDDSVKRTHIGSNGWSRVEFEGKEAYVSSGYLTTKEPKPETEPTEPVVVFITMYANQDTAYRSGAGTGYPIVENVKKGTAIAVVPDSQTDSGFTKIKNAGEYYYIPTAHLSETRPGEETEPTKDPDDPWSRYVGPADPSTGISWDGESPIIYTYEDGTTGTELREGENRYEVRPGQYKIELVTTKDPYDSPLYTEDGWLCPYCLKLAGDGTNGTCMHKLVGGEFVCEFCGETFQGHTCHTCDED